MHNENGSIIVVAVLILALLSIIGVSSVRTSITEQQISTNMLIHKMNFYAAESGAPHGSLWLKEFDLVNDTDKNWFMPTIVVDGADEQEWFGLTNGASYTWKVQHRVNGDGDILYYGDDGTYDAGVKVSEDKDYLYEINTTTGMPLETIYAEGTHPRGGVSQIQTTWIFQHSFPLPQAALFGNELIEKTGGSGSIEGADHSGSGCDDVADISTDGDSGDVDVKDMVLDDDGTVDIKTSQSVYPIPIIRDILLKRATDVMTGIVDTTDAYDGVLFVHPDADGKIDAKKLNGKGILFIDGDLEVNGGIGWEGMVIVYGSITVNGGGGLTTTGSVAAWGDIMLHGSIEIKYDCEVIADIFDKYSSYRMTSWRQM